jgi:hypothetical protein
MYLLGSLDVRQLVVVADLSVRTISGTTLGKFLAGYAPGRMPTTYSATMRQLSSGVAMMLSQPGAATSHVTSHAEPVKRVGPNGPKSGLVSPRRRCKSAESNDETRTLTACFDSPTARCCELVDH